MQKEGETLIHSVSLLINKGLLNVIKTCTCEEPDLSVFEEYYCYECEMNVEDLICNTCDQMIYHSKEMYDND